MGCCLQLWCFPQHPSTMSHVVPKHPGSWPSSNSWSPSGSPPAPASGCTSCWHHLSPPLPSLPGRHKPPLALQTEDKEYDELEEKFQSVASSVTALKENVASYLQHLEVKLRLYAGSWPHPGLRTQSGGCRTPPRPLQTAAGGAQGFVFLSRNVLLCWGPHSLRGLLPSTGG